MGVVEPFEREHPDLVRRIFDVGRERARELLAHPAFGASPLADSLASAYLLGAIDSANAAARMRLREERGVDAPVETGPPDWFSPR